MVDTSGNWGDNLDRDAKNEDYEIWDLKDKEPITKKDCKHHFVLDGEEIGNTVAWKCTICNRGTFIRKGQRIINS